MKCEKRFPMPRENSNQCFLTSEVEWTRKFRWNRNQPSATTGKNVTVVCVKMNISLVNASEDILAAAVAAGGNTTYDENMFDPALCGNLTSDYIRVSRPEIS